MFAFDESNENNEENITTIEITPELQIYLETAENDFNTSKKTLFATFIWTGSRILAEELVKYADWIQNKRILEFGAAAGLPSIVASKLHAQLVCASDYPSPTVIQTLKQNILRNEVDHNVHVIEHIWGEDCSSLLTINDQQQYDLILAAECLWRHECHPALLTSILALLQPISGELWITYSHHIHGLEEDDNQFLVLCQSNGLILYEQQCIQGQHMWSDQLKDIYLCKFKFK